MSPEKVSIVTITNQVAVEFPLPFDAAVNAFARQSRTMEKIALVVCVTNNCSAPPIGEADPLVSVVHVAVSMSGKFVIVVVCIELHEKRDLLQAVQAVC